MADSPPLPTEQPFDPYDGDLDPQWAWKNFGGLTLEDAKVKFRKRPGIYQADFMAMGGKAFAFDYPVLDTHLRETGFVAPEDRDDRQAWVIPQCIKTRLPCWQWLSLLSTYRPPKAVFRWCHSMSNMLSPANMVAVMKSKTYACPVIGAIY